MSTNERPPVDGDSRLTRRFLAGLIVAMVGALGALASLVFLYTARDDMTRGILDTTLAVAGATFAGGVVLCVLMARRIGAAHRAGGRPPRH